jgi:hypothetical protein
MDRDKIAIAAHNRLAEIKRDRDERPMRDAMARIASAQTAADIERICQSLGITVPVEVRNEAEREREHSAQDFRRREGQIQERWSRQ